MIIEKLALRVESIEFGKVETPLSKPLMCHRFYFLLIIAKNLK